METKIYYSVQNCGDGSAYPCFMECEELCEIDQQFMEEGWGESCVGYITIKSDCPITSPSVVTIDEYIKEVEEHLSWEWVTGKSREWLESKLNTVKKLKEKRVKDNG